MVTTNNAFNPGAPIERIAVPEGDWTPTRVRMLAKITGTRDGADWPDIGEEITLPAHEAAALVRQYNATFVEAEPVVERAVVEPEPETETAAAEPLTGRRTSASGKASTPSARR